MGSEHRIKTKTQGISTNTHQEGQEHSSHVVFEGVIISQMCWHRTMTQTHQQVIAAICVPSTWWLKMVLNMLVMRMVIKSVL